MLKIEFYVVNCLLLKSILVNIIVVVPFFILCQPTPNHQKFDRSIFGYTDKLAYNKNPDISWPVFHKQLYSQYQVKSVQYDHSSLILSKFQQCQFNNFKGRLNRFQSNGTQSTAAY